MSAMAQWLLLLLLVGKVEADIWVTGGVDTAVASTDTVYATGGGAWSANVATLPQGRINAGIAIDSSGIVYLSGGSVVGGTPNTNVLELDTSNAAGGWSVHSTLNVAREGHCSFIVDYDGAASLFSVGGRAAGVTYEIEYVPLTGGAATSACWGMDNVNGLADHACAVVGAKVYMVSGVDGLGAFSATTEVWDSTLDIEPLANIGTCPQSGPGGNGGFLPLAGGDVITPRKLPALAVIGSVLYLTGGQHTLSLSDLVHDTETLDTAGASTWGVDAAAATDYMGVGPDDGIVRHCMVADSSKLWIMGGDHNDEATYTTEVRSFDPATPGAGWVLETPSPSAIGRTSCVSTTPVAASGTSSPTTSPTNSPSQLPSTSPTISPSKSPSTSPTISPSKSPSTSPTISPSKSPSTSLTSSPSKSPSASPTVSPSKSPSTSPTSSPSESPSVSPTSSPTDSPSKSPSVSPTISPSKSPSTSPTSSPSESPSTSPTSSPSKSPSTSPTSSPTGSPSKSPSVSPSKSPSNSPTSSPSGSPSVSPTTSPSKSPSTSPTGSPSQNTSASPSTSPSASPTGSPTHSPSTSPSLSPTQLVPVSPSPTGESSSPTPFPPGTPQAIAVIVGGSYRVRSSSSTIQVSAKHSFLPASPSPLAPVSVTWSCERVGGVDDSSCGVDSPPAVTSGTTLALPPDFLEPNSTYRFRACVECGTPAEATATVDVRTVAATPLALVSVRLQGAVEPNSLATIRLPSAVALDPSAASSAIRYSWNVSHFPSNDPVSLGPSVALDSESLVVPPETLLPGSGYEATLVVWVDGKPEGSNSFRIQTAPLPPLAVCTFTDEVEALVTQTDAVCEELPGQLLEFSALLASGETRQLRGPAETITPWSGRLPLNATHVRVGAVVDGEVVAYRDVPVRVQPPAVQLSGLFIDSFDLSELEGEDRLATIGFLAEVLNLRPPLEEGGRRRRARLLDALADHEASVQTARGVLESLAAVASPTAHYDADAAHSILKETIPHVVASERETDVVLALQVLGRLLAAARGDDEADAARFAESRDLLRALIGAQQRPAVTGESSMVVTDGFEVSWVRADGSKSISLGSPGVRLPGAAFPEAVAFTPATVDVEDALAYYLTRVDFSGTISSYAWAGTSSGVFSVRVTAARGEEVEVRDLPSPVSFAAPRCLETSEEEECRFFDPATKAWKRDGCRRASDPAFACECDHLTDFAILRSVATSTRGGSEFTGGPGYLALALVYAGVCAAALDKLQVVLRAKRCEMFVLTAEVSLVAGVALLRVAAMLLYTSTPTSVTFLAALSSATPALTSLMFTGIAYSWGSALGTAKLKRVRKRETFLKGACRGWKGAFVASNGALVLVNAALFGLFVTASDATVRQTLAEVGAIVGVVGQLSASAAFQIVGRRLVKALTMDFSSRHAKGILKVTLAFSACLAGAGLVNLAAIASPVAFEKWPTLFNVVYASFDAASLYLVLYVFRKAVQELEQSLASSAASEKSKRRRREKRRSDKSSTKTTPRGEKRPNRFAKPVRASSVEVPFSASEIVSPREAL